MFKFVLVALFANDVSAHRHHHHHVKSYRPIPGTAPWDKEVPKHPKVDFPHDYFVPNFGVDHDIVATHSNLENAEKTLKTKWNPKQDKDGKWDIPYESNYDVVKNSQKLQMDDSLLELQSDPICGSGGCEKTLPAAPEGHPMDYFVPNFGVDADILANKKSLEIAEKTTGHKWEFKFCEKGKPCNPALWTKYNFAPELSDDVKSTQDSISLAEDQIGH